MGESDFQEKYTSNQRELIEKLDEQNKLLGNIAVDIALLKRADLVLERDGAELMQKIERLEERVRSLEMKLAFAGVLGTLITLIGGALVLILK